MNSTTGRTALQFIHVNVFRTNAPHVGHSFRRTCWRRPAVNFTSAQPRMMSFSLPRVNRPEQDSSSDLNGNITDDQSSPPSSSPMSSVFETLSKATIIGRTGNIADVRQLPSGVRCATLRVATNQLSGSGSAQRVDTQWHTVQIYDSVTGFSVISSLPVGSQLYVEGALRISTYEKDGMSKQYVNVTVSKAQGMFRILRRAYRNPGVESGGVDEEPGSSTGSSTNFPF